MLYRNIIGLSAALVIAGTGLSFATVADIDMPTAYLDECNAKLIAAGYSGVRVVDARKLVLVAYDRDGSEVRLTMHPDNRTVMSESYVRASDE
jgi:hypothetical protein